MSGPASTVRGRSIRTVVRRIIRAPRSRVYAAYTDPALLPKWMGIHAIVEATGPLERAGTTFTEAVFGFGPYRPRTEVLAADAPSLHDMAGRSYFGLGYRWIAHFAESDTDTELTLDAEAIVPGLVGRVLRRLLIGDGMERRMQQRLAIFAALVEGTRVDG